MLCGTETPHSAILILVRVIVSLSVLLLIVLVAACTIIEHHPPMAESAGPSVVKPPVVLPGGTGNNIIVNSCQASSPFSLCDVFQLVSCYRITFTGSVATLSLNALGMWVRNSAKLLQIIKLDAQLVSYF